MRFRLPATLLATVLVAGSVAGCQTNVGVAASVGGSHITESDVNDQITNGGGTSATVGTNKVPSKSVVLELLVQERLLEKTLERAGGVPSNGELTTLSGKAAQLLLGRSATEAVTSITTNLRQSGISPRMAQRFLRVEELRYVLIQRKSVPRFSDPTTTIAQSLTQTLSSQGRQVPADQVKQVAQATAQLIARAPQGASLTQVVTSALGTVLQVPTSQVSQLQVFVGPIVEALSNEQYAGVAKIVFDSHIAVSVSPRYGTWDPQTLTVKDDSSAGVPDFLTVKTASSGG